MRHVIVTRIVVLLSVVFVVAVALFAWAATRPVAAPRAAPQAAGPSGAELFDRHCAMCHDTDIADGYRTAADRDRSAAAFRELLVDHYGPSPDGIALIVEHLMAEGGR
ncbi:MAG: hypothetical protein KJ066_19000 [Acidobacteria bacterium]|nr:hypothetical protein [Acidobacteriota bacterium]